MIKIWGAVLAVLLLLVAGLCLYTVSESETAVLWQGGKLHLDAKGDVVVKMPGLHIHWPFFESPQYLDMRLRTVHVEGLPVTTKDQATVWVSAYFKWRIQNVATYANAFSNHTTVPEAQLQEALNRAFQTEAAQYTVAQLLSPDPEQAFLTAVSTAVNAKAAALGVSGVDLRITHMRLPDALKTEAYAQIQAHEKEQTEVLLEKSRLEAERIRSEAKLSAQLILAEARQKSATIQAEGDAKVALMTAKAYQKDPDFYAYYRALKTYQAAFARPDQTIFLSPSDAFLQYLSPPVMR